MAGRGRPRTPRADGGIEAGPAPVRPDDSVLVERVLSAGGYPAWSERRGRRGNPLPCRPLTYSGK